jgi:hypothetical protein
MKPLAQWDIVTAEVWGENHPAVVISSGPLLGKEYVNILGCSTQRASRPSRSHEIILDASDGLDWPTLCKLAPIFAVRRDVITGKRGEVSRERRREIGRQLIRLFGLWLD